MSTILITGAASGLGWELARQFAPRARQLVLVDIQKELLETRQQELTDQYSQLDVSSFVVDLSDSQAVENLTSQVTESHPQIDILVNNAGITHRSLVTKTHARVFQRVMDVDYKGPVELTLGLLPLLKKSHGTIINISSMASWMPVLGRAGYCAAKSALNQFFETLRCEVRHQGIHILMVYPSFLDTPIEQNALGHDGQPARHQRSTIGQMRTASETVTAILKALDQGKERLFPDRKTWAASVLYKLMPRAYQKLMTRKFASELEQ
ncbi:SDR family oxidoreductase [Parendozoicomonas haliclonae]|uniref:Fatty acyl-CoA reductase n=1 Tax=Parendozoicomonas haliclonae TaxID=1960125 RepID=A0A1X7ANG1_9GAMM|nr:SDR family oxidoreductase [Parendozoicomonas haliclonae]SMA49826.1 Fatty acyl-CoA reductase [Parendozoicomonas haliclonae]